MSPEAISGMHPGQKSVRHGSGTMRSMFWPIAGRTWEAEVAVIPLPPPAIVAEAARATLRRRRTTRLEHHGPPGAEAPMSVAASAWSASDTVKEAILRSKKYMPAALAASTRCARHHDNADP